MRAKIHETGRPGWIAFPEGTLRHNSLKYKTNPPGSFGYYLYNYKAASTSSPRQTPAALSIAFSVDEQEQRRVQQQIDKDGGEQAVEVDGVQHLHRAPLPQAGAIGRAPRDHDLILKRRPVKTKVRALKSSPSSSPATAKRTKPAMPPSAPKNSPPRNLPRISCSIIGNW